MKLTIKMKLIVLTVVIFAVTISLSLIGIWISDTAMT